MCGIAGAYLADWDVPEALARIRHRGPDAIGVREDDAVVHGHVRLAIQDPRPRSDQPFVYRRTTLAFVGEVWNFRALRDELADLGCRFGTDGDTEVVAAALDRWGVNALPRLEGMFALAWTGRAGTYLARDRFGKVPLYWQAEEASLLGGGGVRWASERKAWEPERRSGILPVPPGHVVHLETRRLRAFYRVEEEVERRARVGGPVGPEEVRRLLSEGVRERLQADVPVCCLISGGLDSSAVLRLVKDHKPDVVAYTAVFSDESPDLANARALCRDLGVRLREVPVGDLDGDSLWRSINAIEVVSKTQVEIGTLCLPLAERIYADGYRVCLSGEGADELFGGYGTLARRATDDERWRRERTEFLAKMGRSDFMRVNKSFMAHGVECRVPFLHRPLVEAVLGLGVRECPPGKKLLKRAFAGDLPDEIVKRPKMTFQGAAGVAAHYDALLEGKQRLIYNAMAREAFGAIPRG
jgi:asparagine synthase (glutamine-hydrolysing)